MSQLEIKNLHVSIEGKEILKGVDLTVEQGKVHAIMGPNGTGKSTLAYTLMGHPSYIVTEGEVIFKGQNVLELEPDERSRLGLFLAFQYPVAIPGVTVANFLRTAINARRRAENPEDKGMPIPEFRKLLKEKMAMLKMDQNFAGRYLNEGFSGGEKKRAEILQMATLTPEIAILDETDSGLDIDALRIVSEGVNALMSKDLGVLVITHYQRLLNYIKPDFVHVMLGGRIVESGGPDLALHLEEKGYDDLDHARVERVGCVLRCGAALHIMDLGTFLDNNERAFELSQISRVQAEVCLQGQIHFHILRYIDKRSARPDGAIQCGKFVVFDRYDRSKILAEQVRVLLQAIFNAQEDHALLFEMLLDRVVYHLGFILCTQPSQELPFSFGHAQSIKCTLDVIGDIVP